jgi:hypothetical protein
VFDLKTDQIRDCPASDAAVTSNGSGGDGCGSHDLRTLCISLLLLVWMQPQPIFWGVAVRQRLAEGHLLLHFATDSINLRKYTTTSSAFATGTSGRHPILVTLM